MRKKEISLCFIFILICFLILFSFRSFPYVLNEDEARLYYSTLKFLDSGNVNYKNPLNDKYDTFAFALPRAFTVYDSNGNLYPQTTAHSLSFYILIGSFTGEYFKSIFFWQNIVLMTILLFLVFLFFKYYFSTLTSLLLSFIFFSLPVSLVISVMQIDFIISFTFFLMALMALSKRNLGLFLFLSILSTLFRPTYVFLFIFTFIFLIEKKKSLKQIFKVVIPLVFFALFSFFSLNALFFEDPFFIPYLHGSTYPGYESSQTMIDVYFNFRSPDVLKNIVKNSVIFFRDSLKLFFPFVILSVVGIFISFFQKNKIENFFFLCFFLINLIYFSKIGGNLFGFGTLRLDNNFFRYLLPAVFVLIYFLGFFFMSFFKFLSKETKIVVVVILVVLMLNSIFSFYSYGIYEGNLKYHQDFRRLLHDFSQKNTEDFLDTNSSIFLTSNMKAVQLFYPKYKNFLFSEGVPQDMREEELEKVSKKLLRDGYSLYVLSCENEYCDLDSTTNMFIRQNFMKEDTGLVFSWGNISVQKLIPK